MVIEVKVPVLPESVADATVLNWHKKVGESVARDENLVDLETDKVVLEVPAPMPGVIEKILINQGTTVKSNEILAIIQPQGAAPVSKESVPTKNIESEKSNIKETTATNSDQNTLSPAVRRLVAEHNVDVNVIQGSGKGGRVLKEDVLQKMPLQESGNVTNSTANKRAPAAVPFPSMEERPEQRVPMSRLRARIAERLVSAQHNAAILTTFNEVNLKAVMALRAKYQESFQKEYGVKVGFMSFFTKAVVEALKRFPAVNASIDGQDIIYHGYYDMGIAVSTERGLVVPVIRDVDRLSMGEIEQQIADYAERARTNKLTIEEMQGGTFSITNGGVFGSLLATPIINPPQTAILGMHKIQERPVVENGEIVIRPMMYLALSYDHRIIDGKESVQFLVAIKNFLEDPARLLLEV